VGVKVLYLCDLSAILSPIALAKGEADRKALATAEAIPLNEIAAPTEKHRARNDTVGPLFKPWAGFGHWTVLSLLSLL